jgi:sugar lactone lactonase YvrE
VLVVDRLGSRIQEFDSGGTFQSAFGALGTGNGQFTTPSGIAVDSSDNVYVADTGNNRIQKFDSTGTYLTQWGGLGTGDGQFNSPSGVAVDSHGYVYVADTGNTRIQKFNSSGSFVDKWGSLGTGDGQFGAATTPSLDLAIGGSDNVLVVDPVNSRVQKFRPIGTFITKWGSAGSGDSQFTSPAGVAAASSGSVYVVDQGNNRVQRFHESDVTSPDTTLDSGPSGTSGGNVSFSFSSTESPLLGFECRLDSNQESGWQACSSPKGYSSLTTGDHDFEVRSVDAAGNPDPTPVTRSWTVDATPPQTTIDSGPSGLTNDASPSFTFSSSEGGSSFECRLDSSQAADWQSCNSPRSYSLADGPHAVEVRATDQYGNTDQTPASRSFSIDSQAPQTTIDTGPSGTSTDPSPSFTFSSSEGESSFECRLDSSQAADWQSCNSPRAFSSLGDGSHTFEVRATDQAGNVDASPASRSFTIDTTGPQTTIGSGPSGATNNPSTAFSFSSSEPGSSFECRLDSDQPSGWQSCTSPKDYGSLADGSHSFQVRATDPVGNTDASPASRAFTIDTVAPPIPRITATNPVSPANNNNPRVKGNAQAGSRVKIYKTSGCSGSPLAVGKAARFHSTGVGVSVADNTTTKLRATVTDLAGNVSGCSKVRQYVEDSKAPPAPSIKATSPNSPANENQPLVRGFAEAPSAIALYTAGCSGSPIATGVASPFHFPGLSVSVLDNTTTTFRATATDAAGNTSPCSGPWRYVEDSISPQTTIVAGPTSQTTIRRPTFRFESSEMNSTFRCRFDSQPFGRCSGPGASHTPYVQLALGSHTFAVRAADRAGNADPTAAKRTFSVIP